MTSMRTLLLRSLGATLLLASALSIAHTGPGRAVLAQDTGSEADGDADSHRATVVPETVVSRTETAREAAADLDAVRELVVSRIGEEEGGEILLRLDLAIGRVKRLGEPLRLDQLTESERRTLAREMEQARARAPQGLKPTDGLDSWQRRALRKALDGVDLDQEQKRAAEEIVARWFRDAWAARAAGDTKRLSDLKRSRDADLREAVGRNRARKIAGNLADLSRR